MNNFRTIFKAVLSIMVSVIIGCGGSQIESAPTQNREEVKTPEVKTPVDVNLISIDKITPKHIEYQ
jgi:hypothetical protein